MDVWLQAKMRIIEREEYTLSLEKMVLVAPLIFSVSFLLFFLFRARAQSKEKQA
jgi:hypothetical protein